MDWFERLTGFRETGYADTRLRLEVQGRKLRSRVNGKSYGIGELELVSLQALREYVRDNGGLPGKLQVRVITGDVRRLHQAPEYVGALFQVASQFNLLEMISPNVTPEDGVTRYESDHTQGPACALAAGAATIYRNYFASVGSEQGQTSVRQLNGLADVGIELARALRRPVEDFWTMRNGYAACSRTGLDSISKHLTSLGPSDVSLLGDKLRIGLHWDVEVTDADSSPGPLVSQAFCSALPVSYYSEGTSAHWQPFASLVLQAAYEATIWAAVRNAQRGVSNIVLLTRLGGGVFGNADHWINNAIRHALKMAVGLSLDVRIVSHGPPSDDIMQLAGEI
jgi:hypothetical protein